MQNNSHLDVLLVGFEEQENIGLRSIMSCLLSAGYKVNLYPFRRDNIEEISALALKTKPLVIGFSIIFQYTISDFTGLITQLRNAGVTCHFTAGGHFPTIQPEETLKLIPGLDSIVRHEGEYTMLDLVEHLKTNDSLTDVKGLALRNSSGIILNEPRGLIEYLDALPLIYRDEPRSASFKVKSASIIASRGCYYNCSFCSIREYYGSANGTLRRTRSPRSVASEMELLYKDKGVIFFLFWDDDFATRTVQQKIWLNEFLNELRLRQLDKVIKWKISCRVDDVDPDIFEEMVSCGLMAVYLGVESGNEKGLQTLNKKVSVDQNLNAVRILKELDVMLGMGFMMFDPYSTFSSVKENIHFLSEAEMDGYVPVNFCKMLPYAGTPIQRQLIKENRLKGTLIEPDYELTEPQLEWYSEFINRIFRERNFGANGLVLRIQDLDLRNRFSTESDKRHHRKKLLREITKKANTLALNTLSETLCLFENHDAHVLLEQGDELIDQAAKEWRGEAELFNQLEYIEKNFST